MIKNTLAYFTVLSITIIISCPDANGQCIQRMTGTFTGFGTNSEWIITLNAGDTTLDVSSTYGHYATFCCFDCSNRTFSFVPVGKCVVFNGNGSYSCNQDTIYTVTYTTSGGGEDSYATFDTLIRQDSIPIPINIKTSQACSGCNGTALATIPGFNNNKAYSYRWSNGETTNPATGLCPGTYALVFTDSSSDVCQPFSLKGVTTIKASDLPAVTFDAPVISAVTTPNGDNGSALAISSGGTPPFKYMWLPYNYTYNPAINLTAGVYTVMATDFKGCINFDTITVNDSLPPSVDVFPNPSDGIFTMQFKRTLMPCTINVYNLSGKQVYTTKLSNPNSTSLLNISTQADGIYIYRITDDNGTMLSKGKLVIEK